MNSATLRGVTVGEGTLYPFAGPPQIPGSLSRQATTPLLTGGLAFRGRDVGDAGSLALEVLVNGATSAAVMPLVSTLTAAWAPSMVDDVEELTVTLADQARVYRGRPTSAIPDLTWLPEGRLAAVRLAFQTADDRWFAALTNSVTVAVSGATGGMVTPMATPMVTTGSGSTGDASVANGGTAPAPWQATIFGPVTTPRLIMNGQAVTIEGDIAAGSIAVVDSREGSVVLDGSSRPWISLESVWWEIPPGASTFSFRAAAGTGSATLTWRDASY